MEINDIEDIYQEKFSKKILQKYTKEEVKKLECIVIDFLETNRNDDSRKHVLSKHQISEQFMKEMMRKYKITPRKEEILYIYRRMETTGNIPSHLSSAGKFLLESFKKKGLRETSGVMVFTLLSSPYPETGEFAYMESVNNDNVIYIKNRNIVKTDKKDYNNYNNDLTKVTLDPMTGIIKSIAIIKSNNNFLSLIFGDPKFEDIASVKINSEDAQKKYRENNQEKTNEKFKILKVGNNISSLIDPMNGELRQDFSCPFDCYFCPSQPDMPKSYEDKEPAVARSLRNAWNPIMIMRERFYQYVTNGMEVDKLEVIVKGGTWTSYNSYYRREFCKNLFYAANTFWDSLDSIRAPKSLSEEQEINETAKAHIIGLTVETRPDYITNENLIEFRECGITRLELGFQHTDNKILKKVNRQHTVEDSIKGIAKLLSCGFKVDIHLMPGLPNSTFEKDKEMVTKVLTTKWFCADQLKWYPTIVTPYTVIKKWYDKGRYVPWIEDIDKLIELSVYFKTSLNEWNRTNRIQRDFTKDFICGGSYKSNLGDMIKRKLSELGKKCKCIRCREVRNQTVDMNTVEMIVRKFESHTIGSEGDIATEYFISFEANSIVNEGTVILGFLRLRLDPNAGLDVFPELRGCAMIRELHVYGKMNKVNSNYNSGNNIQHLGLGKKLVKEAKNISRKNGYNKISVISGVGVRNYYRTKHNFYDGEHYLLCDL